MQLGVMKAVCLWIRNIIGISEDLMGEAKKRGTYEERKINAIKRKGAQAMENKMVMEIKIQVTNDGRVGVVGFPKNMVDATRIMTAALNSVVEFFGQYAKDGKLDKNGTIVENKIVPISNKIIVPKNGRLN